MMKKYYYFITFLMISLFVTSCGLPSFTVVDPPVTTGEGSTTYVAFQAPSDSNIDGYEIYYKIYQSGVDEISDDEDKFDIDAASYVYEFGNTKPSSLSFKRLMRLDSGSNTNIAPSTPFISSGSASNELDTGEECRVYLLSSGTADYIELAGITNGTPLRVATDSDEYFKDFSTDSVGSGDSDNNGVVSIDTEYSVSFVAFSYVNNSVLVDYESSYPVFLGTIDNISNN